MNERWSYASGSTYQRIILRSTALTGVPSPPRTPGRRRSERSAETGQSRSASSRAARRSAGSPPPAGIGPGEAHLLAQALEERVDVDRASDGSARARVRVYRAVRHRGIVAPPPDATGPLGPATGPARQYDRPVISVCMATFNGARFVERQVATILEQLEPGDELVVSDDGSDRRDRRARARVRRPPRSGSSKGTRSAARCATSSTPSGTRAARRSCSPTRTTSGSRTSSRSCASCSPARRARPYLVVLDARDRRRRRARRRPLGARQAPRRARAR